MRALVRGCSTVRAVGFTPGSNASSPDVGEVLLRTEAALSGLAPCAPVCRQVESILLSQQHPRPARMLVGPAIARASGRPLADVLEAWDSANVREGRPLAEAVAFCQEGGHAHAARLADALVRLESLSHVALVWHQANKFSPSFPGYAPADLVGWGWAGLRMALRRYDPSLGYRFSTYACTRIVGAMRDGVRSERHVPKRLGTFQRRLDEVSMQLEESLGRQPTLQELSDVTGEPREKVMAAQRARPSVPLDQVSESSAPIVASPDAELLSPSMDAALSGLSRDMRRVMRLSVVDELSDAQVAEELGVSTAAVRSLRSEAISRLRGVL